jgi:hypothetical protein
MKTIGVIFFFILVSNVYGAVILPAGSLECLNATAHKKTIIAPNTAIVIWYRNEQNIQVKVKGIFKKATDSIVEFSPKGSKNNLQIPLNKIDAVKRRNRKLIWSSFGLMASTFVMIVVTKLLINAGRSNNNRDAGGNSSYGNGIAGVVGIIGAIIAIPLFILTGYWFIKQLNDKPMQTKKGWQFTAIRN